MATPAVTPSSTALTQIQATYFYLNDNFDALYAACGGDNAKTTSLRSSYVTARDGFYATVNGIIAENDPLVAAESDQLATLNSQIQQSVIGLGTIAKVLQNIDSAVQLVTKIAMLGVV